MRFAVPKLLCSAVLAVICATAVVSAQRSDAPVKRDRVTLASAAVGSKLTAESDPGLQAAYALAPKVVLLHPATAAPQPAPDSVVHAPAVRPHEVFAFAPYWTLQGAGQIDVNDASTVAYFGLDVNGDGSVSESGAGWDGYGSAELVDLIDRAHQAGDRVVLSVECFDQSALDQLTSDPNAPARLAGQLATLVAAKNLDGVNFDFEGTGSADRAGMVRLIGAVDSRLWAADPNWQLTVDTYASAMDGGGFFDAQALAPEVDALFVMAYDMGSRSTPSPTAPLTGAGYTDQSVVNTWAAGVDPKKVILGIPFYGYSWPTTGNWQGATPTGPASPVTYGQLLSAGDPVYWDGTTQTPWTAWQSNGQWYEAYFDNPQSVALKVQAADRAGLGGVGVWALGFDGGDSAMLTAITGQAPPQKDYTPAPAPSSQAVVAAGAGVSAAPQLSLGPAASPAAGAAPAGAAGAPVTGTVGAANVGAANGAPGGTPPPNLCSLLVYDGTALATIQSAAQQQAGRPLPGSLQATTAALAATIGCHGAQTGRPPASGHPAQLCSLLAGQAAVAAVIQGAAGISPSTSLGNVVGQLAAAVGCPGITAQPNTVGYDCSGLGALLATMGTVAAPVQAYAELKLGSSLGVDVAGATAGLASDCVGGQAADPSPQLPTLCTLVADLGGVMGPLQQAAEVRDGPLGVSLASTVSKFGAVVGCP
jgi:hypothetical protein